MIETHYQLAAIFFVLLSIFFRLTPDYRMIYAQAIAPVLAGCGFGIEIAGIILGFVS